MEAKTKRIWSEIKAYAIITFGLAIYVSGWVGFIIPNHLVGGGVSGIGALIQYATGFPVFGTFLLINIVLLLIALKVLGTGFGVKTVYAIIVATFFFSIFPRIFPPELIDDLSGNTKLISAIFGGIMSGAGIGIAFTQGGSTGGTDIVALMINKYRNISPGRIILYIDVAIISCSFFVHDPSVENLTFGKRLSTVLYGFIAVGITGYTIDMILSGARQSQQFFVFSKKYDIIARRIATEMQRGVTIIDSTGWYTKEEQKIVMIIARKTESNNIYRIIKDVDKDAFMSVGNVMGVYGKGFDEIRTK